MNNTTKITKLIMNGLGNNTSDLTEKEKQAIGKIALDVVMGVE